MLNKCIFFFSSFQIKRKHQGVSQIEVCKHPWQRADVLQKFKLATKDQYFNWNHHRDLTLFRIYGGLTSSSLGSPRSFVLHDSTSFFKALELCKEQAVNTGLSWVKLQEFPQQKIVNDSCSTAFVVTPVWTHQSVDDGSNCSVEHM